MKNDSLKLKIIRILSSINKIIKANADIIAVFLVVLFIMIFAIFSFGRHDALKSYLNDLGTYDQVVWNTLHGDFFGNSANMLEVYNYLGAHFSPILLLFVPFYTLYATSKWLLFFQAAAVGLSALPVYWLAKEKLKNALAGLVFLICYLLYPVLQNGLLYDFHEVVFAVPFAAFAFYFLEKKKDGWFVFFAALLALSQEHLPLLVFMMGLYLIFVKKRWKFGAAVSAVSLAYFFLVLGALMPHFSGTGSSAMLANSSEYGSRYAWLGSSISEVSKNIVFHPASVAKVAFSPERLKYIFYLVFPVFSLALFSWPVVIIAPLILINILSLNSMTFSLFFYHSAIMAPFIFFASIETFGRWFAGDKFMTRLFLGLIFASSLASSIIFGLTPLSSRYELSDYMPSAHAGKIHEIQKIIPPAASLSVQHNLGSHFSERRDLFRFPVKKDEAEYILLDTTDVYQSNPKQFFQFEYSLQMIGEDWLRNIAELKKSKKYELIYDNDGYLLFRKKD